VEETLCLEIKRLIKKCRFRRKAEREFFSEKAVELYRAHIWIKLKQTERKLNWIAKSKEALKTGRSQKKPNKKYEFDLVKKFKKVYVF